MSSSLRRNFARHIAIVSACTFAGFFLLGYGGILVWSGNTHAPTPIWPATAFGMCMLLRLSRSRRQDLLMLGAILLAGLLANRLGGLPLPLTIAYSSINVLDVTAGLFA